MNHLYYYILACILVLIGIILATEPAHSKEVYKIAGCNVLRNEPKIDHPLEPTIIYREPGYDYFKRTQSKLKVNCVQRIKTYQKGVYCYIYKNFADGHYQTSISCVNTN